MGYSRVEAIEGGWIHPTNPQFGRHHIDCLRLLLQFSATAHRVKSLREIGMAVIYFCLLAAGVWLMSVVGFVVAGPVLAAALMLFIGERRPLC